MAIISYYRVSTLDQSIDTQRATLLNSLNIAQFDKEFFDEGISGSVPALLRPGFLALTKYIREGDTLYIYAVDRLGRDALDIQSTIRALLNKNIMLHIHGLGMVGKGVGELIIAVLAQVADMEKQRIAERTMHGRLLAKKSLAETGRTHRGKLSLGRPIKADSNEVLNWRNTNKASLSQTALHFNLSLSTVKRYCSGEK
ncbi:MAG: resolvase [Methylotenera sp.]|nr:MAG: resolvase [Methylotenera sp.]